MAALFAERLRQADASGGLSAEAGLLLEREFNQRYWASQSACRRCTCRWLRGEAIPSQDKLEVLSEWLKSEGIALWC